MKSLVTKEVKIGIVAVVSLVMLYVGINYLKGINLFQPSNYYYVSCTNVKDLSISGPVYIDGFKVGMVRAINYDYDSVGKITVEVTLDKGMKVNKGSYMQLERTLLNGTEMHLRLNEYVTEYMEPGSTIEGRLGDDMMADVQQKILPQVEQILPRIDSILQSLQAIVSDPAIVASLKHIEQTTNSLEASSRQMSRLLNNDVPLIMSDLKTITGDFSIVSGNLKALDLATTVNTVNQTMGNLQLTTQKMNSTDNTLGLLLNDTALYRGLTNTTDNASKLLIDFRENPKRYVRFSVF